MKVITNSVTLDIADKFEKEIVASIFKIVNGTETVKTPPKTHRRFKKVLGSRPWTPEEDARIAPIVRSDSVLREAKKLAPNMGRTPSAIMGRIQRRTGLFTVSQLNPSN